MTNRSTYRHPRNRIFQMCERNKTKMYKHMVYKPDCECSAAKSNRYRAKDKR